MNASDMQQCIQNCTNCHAICIGTIQHCLGKGGRHAQRDHIRLLADCAQICRTSADFMIRGSDLHPHICRACAAVCARCADECDAMGDDPYMAACSEICRRTALSCAEMAGRAA
jgi:hypothetical protein